MRICRLCFYLSSVLLSFISVSQSCAQPHTHGIRSHTHGLPAQGVGHRHNKGIAGKTAAPRVKYRPQARRSVPRSAPIDEKTYSSYKRCVGWWGRRGDYNDEIDSAERKIKSNNRAIDRISDQRSSAKNWMSIQEAAGDVNGHNRNVRKFNSLGRKGRRIKSENDDLVDRTNSKVRRSNSLLRDIRRKCKSFPRNVVKKGCENGYRSRMCKKL